MFPENHEQYRINFRQRGNNTSEEKTKIQFLNGLTDDHGYLNLRDSDCKGWLPLGVNRRRSTKFCLPTQCYARSVFGREMTSNR